MLMRRRLNTDANAPKDESVMFIKSMKSTIHGIILLVFYLYIYFFFYSLKIFH